MATCCEPSHDFRPPLVAQCRALSSQKPQLNWKLTGSILPPTTLTTASCRSAPTQTDHVLVPALTTTCPRDHDDHPAAAKSNPPIGSRSPLNANTALGDLFGSRLGPGQAGELRAAATDESGATGGREPAAESNLFASRQGQLAPSGLQQDEPMRRPQQRPQAQNFRSAAPQLVARPQQQQQQFLRQPPVSPGGQPNPVPQAPEGRFQRLRAPPVGEQFPRPQQQQFASPGAVQLPARPPTGLQLGLPTLSAFDLSSLANLANNQPPQFGSGPPQQVAGPQQQQQSNFRRPPNQQTPAQQAPAQQPQQPLQPRPNPTGSGNIFEGLSRAQQVPASSSLNGPQTELPFIRQVFRPATAPQTEPPEMEASGPSEARPSSGRPTPPPLFVPSRQQPAAGQQVAGQRAPQRPLESGFSPMQPLAFFEPSSGRQPQRPAVQRQQQQQPAQQQPPVRPAEQQRKPVRRPSQRPQVPAATSGSPQPGRAQQSANDVIRLASSAIQTVNDGLAALAGPLGLPAAPQTSTTLPVESSTVPATTTTTSTTAAAPPASSEAASSTASEQPATTTAAAATTSGELASTGRRAAPASLRTSANLFALTSAATSAPPAFSPALPINAAVAASGQRRRIPVRPGQQLATGGRLPVTTQAMVAPTTTTTAPTRLGASVRRPEIEEFYETIGNGFSSTSLNSASTAIDGFGAPSRAQPATGGEAAATTSTVPSLQSAGAGADLYGSRLAPGEQPAEELAAHRQPPVGLEAPQRQQQPQLQQPAAPQQQQQPQQPPVMVPVTYMTTLTYLTTVLHGTHTLETSHESVERSTRLATLNAQLMDQIENRLPLIEPTATVSLSSRTKGRGTTLINLKSAVSAYNQELVEALGQSGAGGSGQVQPTSVPSEPPVALQTASQPQLQQVPIQRQRPRQPVGRRPSRTVELAELEEAKKSLLTEFVYFYTVRPLDPADQQAPVTSVRSELVAGPSVDNQQLMGQLMAQAATGGLLIDSNGLMRAESGAEPATALNLGKFLERQRAHFRCRATFAYSARPPVEWASSGELERA